MFNYADTAFVSSVFLVVSFFFLSTLLAWTSLSTNSITANGALSPYLYPDLIILVYPPFLPSYLLARVFLTLLADLVSWSLEINIFVFCKLFFFPKVIILSAWGFKTFA